MNKQQLTYFILYIYIYKCKYIPSSHWHCLRLHFLQWAVHATGALDPQRKLMGKWVIERTLQTGCEDMMGSGETCASTESLIRLIDDRSVSPWEACDRWHLTPLKYQKCRHPPVSTSRPIRIDCSTSTLLHGQVTAVSSSSLITMMLHIDPIAAVCCVE